MDSILGWCEKDRKLKTHGFAKAIVADSSIQKLLSKVANDEVFKKVISEGEVCEIIEAFIKWRLLGLAFPEKVYDLSLSDIEVNNAIRDHFKSIGLSEKNNLFREIILIASNLRQKLQGSRKKGIGDIRDFKNRQKLGEILKNQNMRCYYCGKKFDQIEGADVQLDHLIPFHIGDDVDGNWVISCQTCNRGKKDSLHYCLEQHKHDGVKISYEGGGNFEQLRWAVLNRLQKCSTCLKGPRDTHLNVVKIYKMGIWTLANCNIQCDSCISDSVGLKI